MALLKFLKGDYAKLNNTAVAEGQILICNDTAEMFVDVAADKRIKIGDFTVVANLTALEALDATAVPTSRLYYVEDGNILARSNGTAWVQVNKQPTPAELKTLLGLGSMAYVSEVAEANLSAELAAKVNAVDTAKHTHDNKDVIDGITAEKVTAWNAAEGNAKTYADGLNTAMNTRVEALEAIDHEHANKALLDTYTQTEADLADAVVKKHAHTFNETELNKIVEGDVAKWNGVAADHLTSADKTTLENAIKDAKKAGTDANTNIEAYKVTNDARVLAVEEDIAEITNAENGVLAQAKAYSDGKLATARTEITAEIDADVKVVADDLAGYKTSNDAALAGVKATAEAAAVKTEVETALAGKVDKVEGKSLVADTEITKLAGVSEGANKVEASTTNGNIKIDGVETVVYTHPEKHAIADVIGLQDALDGKQAAGDYAAEEHTHVKADITDFAHTHTASEITDLDTTIKAYDYATKAEAQGYADAKDDAIAAAQKAGDDAAAAVTAHATEAANTYETKADASAKLTEAKGYTDTEVAKVQGEVDALETLVGTLPEGTDATTVVGYIDAKTANIASDETVGAIADRVTAIEDDYLKAADKTELANAIAAEKTRAEGVEAGLQTQINTILNNPDAEGAINSINEFTKYIEDHGEIAEGFRTDIDKNKEDIAANAKAIADQATSDAATYETKTDATAKLTEAKTYADGLNTAMDTRVKVLEAIDHEAYKAYADQAEADAVATAAADATAKANAAQAAAEATAAADATAKADQALADAKAYTDKLANGAVKTNADNIAALVEQLTWGSFAE